MADTAYVLLTLGGFAALLLLVRALELMGSRAQGRDRS